MGTAYTAIKVLLLSLGLICFGSWLAYIAVTHEMFEGMQYETVITPFRGGIAFALCGVVGLIVSLKILTGDYEEPGPKS